MLTQYNLKMPHAVYGGENAMDNITAIIKARGAKKVALFTDKGIEAAGLFTLPEEAVKAAGADYIRDTGEYLYEGRKAFCWGTDAFPTNGRNQNSLS